METLFHLLSSSSPLISSNITVVVLTFTVAILVALLSTPVLSLSASSWPTMQARNWNRHAPLSTTDTPRHGSKRPASSSLSLSSRLVSSLSSFMSDNDESRSLLVEQQERVEVENDGYTTTIRGGDGRSTGRGGGGRVLHVIVLAHGYKGLPMDLSYMHQAIASKASQLTSHSTTSTSSSSSKNNNHNHNNATFVIHTASCNAGRTDDGIVDGGHRLAEEIQQVLQHVLNKKSAQDRAYDRVTLSLVGNSLGGLYCRHAIHELYHTYNPENQQDHTKDPSCISIPISLETNKSVKTNLSKSPQKWQKVHLNVFCTTATPHLGIARQTYVQIPRLMEVVVAKVFMRGDTGQDLFRLNPLLSEMCTSPTYLQPLSAFCKRLAYANAYYTDLVVPHSTAAFLHQGSEYPHYNGWGKAGEKQGEKEEDMVREKEEEGGGVRYGSYGHGMVAVEVFTEPPPAETEKEGGTNAAQPHHGNEDHDDDKVMLQMSQALDALGWTKVFIDMREEIPIGVGIPVSWWRSLFSPTNVVGGEMQATISSGELLDLVSSLESPVGGSSTGRSAGPSPQAPSLFRQSRSALSAARWTWSWPMGHNMLVAFSRKDSLRSLLHRRGRPVMDGLAEQLVEEVVMCCAE